MRALAIDTSTHRSGVALFAQGRVVARETNDEPSRHAERLFPMIDQVFASAGFARSDVDLVVCCVGPGSFTGIRVGLAAAKGIALGLDRPLVGVGSLEAMASAARGGDVRASGVVAALLDARKGEIFWAAYGDDSAIVAPPQHVAASDIDRALLAIAPGGVTAIGEVVEGLTLSPAVRRCRSQATDLPDAEAIARLGVAKFLERGPDDLDLVEPVYVRPPDITSPKTG